MNFIKENCTDVRNSKVFEIVDNFENLEFDLYDPWVKKEFKKIRINKISKNNYYDAILITVGHNSFKLRI